MPINVIWKDESKTVLLFIYEGQWALSDFYDITQKGNEMLDEVTYPVNMLLDIRGSKMLPNGFINAISNVSRRSHPNTGIMVMVGINVFARTFIGWYRKVYPTKAGEKTIYYAGSYDEAQAIIDRLAVVSAEITSQ
jgi:hypothetical protein